MSTGPGKSSPVNGPPLLSRMLCWMTYFSVIACCAAVWIRQEWGKACGRCSGAPRQESCGGVIFNSPNKLTLATRGREMFEDRRLRIPAGDVVLRSDLHKLRKITGPTGAPRFVAESDAAGHADRTWACFLAINATDGPSGPVVARVRAAAVKPPACWRDSDGKRHLGFTR